MFVHLSDFAHLLRHYINSFVFFSIGIFAPKHFSYAIKHYNSVKILMILFYVGRGGLGDFLLHRLVILMLKRTYTNDRPGSSALKNISEEEEKQFFVCFLQRSKTIGLTSLPHICISWHNQMTTASILVWPRYKCQPFLFHSTSQGNNLFCQRPNKTNGIYTTFSPASY